LRLGRLRGRRSGQRGLERGMGSHVHGHGHHASPGRQRLCLRHALLGRGFLLGRQLERAAGPRGFRPAERRARGGERRSGGESVGGAPPRLRGQRAPGQHRGVVLGLERTRAAGRRLGRRDCRRARQGGLAPGRGQRGDSRPVLAPHGGQDVFAGGGGVRSHVRHPHGSPGHAVLGRQRAGPAGHRLRGRRPPPAPRSRGSGADEARRKR
ncbi:hypothetical protein H632_c4351p0, partial [Helicosporidium sp. ATCC 50920]